MRSAIEQIGVYTHVWYEPGKAQHVGDVDSESYMSAFRCCSGDKPLQDRLRAQKVKYRFMHCKGGAALSRMYQLLSEFFIHGYGASPPIAEGLSCEFVDRATPAELDGHYRIVQKLLSLVFTEVIMCVPKEDWFDDDIAAIMLASALFLPTLSKSSDEPDPVLQNSIDKLFGALENVEWVPSE